MSYVIDNIVVGSFQESFDYNILEKWNVTHILNVATELNVNERVERSYVKHAVPDDCPDTDITTIFDACIQYIDSAHKAHGCVFVHCLEGKSRSVCVVLAYLVTKRHWSFDAVLSSIMMHRPQIDPYPIYLDQTRAYCDLNIRKKSI